MEDALHVRAKFASLISKLGIVFGHDPTKLQMVAYFEALINKDLDAIEWAANEWIKTGTYFPKPVHLLDLSKKAPKNAIVNEVQKLIPENCTPREEAMKRLEEVFNTLNDKFGTNLKTDAGD